ncbi:hypothetical protein B0J12DRAFT_737720 [Macrophomina phaseolina]|uniref:DNA-binding protein RAP1 n=1 Tax=Macrophomina phaseolina TaxID=35725 RepID=A0ABQ8GKY8_9PEZI|nr:hypothetical protein B0J12DRAFT_737720 [Macrophomina phaseolina]
MLVIDNVRAEPPVKGDLFAGKKFWMALRVPMRSDFIKRVTYNGGEVVQLEKHADYLIVDGARKDVPPGGITFQFIEQCIKRGELLDPEQYRKGPPVGSVREIGSTQSTRRGRVPFTAQDDIELYTWVKGCELKGIPVKGNEIYKDLERKNSRHPWQSWRARYVDHLVQKPPKTVSANPPPSPPSDPQPSRSSRQVESEKKNARKSPEVRISSKGKQRRVSPSPSPPPSPVHRPKTPPSSRKEHDHSSLSDFTLGEFDYLLSQGDYVMEIPYGRLKEAWATWANANPVHSAEEWSSLFDAYVKPIWEDLRMDRARASIYDEAWKIWSNEHGEDGQTSEWLEYYQEHVLPSFPPPQADGEEPEVKEEPETPRIEGESDKAQGQEEEPEEMNLHRVEPVSGILEQTTTAPPPSQLPVALGKRRREHVVEEHGDEMATPSPKRHNTDGGVSSTLVQESIEVSPTKRFLKSPAHHPDVDVSVASSQSASSPLPDDTPPPDSQHSQPQPDTEVYDEGQDDTKSQAPESRIRQAIAGLNEDQMYNLLETLRMLPNAPKEPIDIDLREVLIIHMAHFLVEVQQAQSQAVYIVGDKLAELGVLDILVGGDEGGEGQDDEHDHQLDVVGGEVVAEEEPAKEFPPDSLEVEIYRSPTPRAHHSRQPPPSSTATSFQSSHQKQQKRPLSSSGGTAMTSFEMPSQPAYDLGTDDLAEAYINSRVAPPYNFPLEHVISALHATCSYSTSMADAVLQWMRTNATGGNRKGRAASFGLTMLPDEPGVWTKEDDEALEGLTLERKRMFTLN